MIDETQPVWRTRDGEEIPLAEMRTQHILFSVDMIKRSIAAGHPWRTRWLPLFEAELARRQQTVEGLLQQAYLQKRVH